MLGVDAELPGMGVPGVVGALPADEAGAAGAAAEVGAPEPGLELEPAFPELEPLLGEPVAPLPPPPGAPS